MDTEDLKIVRNAIKCKHCGEVIESRHAHDFKTCKCGRVFVDGGRDYIRHGGNNEDYEDLSIVRSAIAAKLEQQAKCEMIETGTVKTRCPKCGDIPIVKIEGLYGETVSVRCKCGFLYCVERGI